ncbi:MAG: nucleotidyltransferase domain-containing protein [Candidatus Thorarchaeota archaeon]
MSYERFTRALRERSEKREREFPVFVERLRESTHPSCAILFGSRVRGTASYMSDYDLLLITRDKVPEKKLRMWAQDFGVDLFVVHLSDADILLERAHTVLPDALMDGRVLYDDIGVVDQLKKKSLRVTDELGIHRTAHGWMPRYTN